MFWNLFPIADGKYEQHWQPDMRGEIEIMAGGNQPFRLRFNETRKGIVVLMQGLAYTNPNTGRRFVFPAVVEDWREVGFIPFVSEAKADPAMCHEIAPDHSYKYHSEILFHHRQRGSDAYPDVTPNGAGNSASAAGAESAGLTS